MHLMMQQAGVNATNERRRYENLPPEGDVNDPDNEANKPLRPVNMVPIGAEPVMIRVTETAPPDESGAPGPPSNDQADPAALIDGLPLLKEAFRAGIPAVPETEQEGDDA